MGTLLEKFSSKSTNFKSQMGSKHSNLKNEDIEAFSKSSGMSPEEVKAEYTGFLEKFPDGSIDKKEFKDLIKLLLPSEDAEKQEGYVFRLYDISSDGNITKKELKKMFKDLAKMGNPDIAKATNAFFDLVDEDENGKINLDEFIEFCSGNEVFLQSLK